MPGPLSGTLAGVSVLIPVGGISDADGATLKGLTGQTITVDMNSTTETRTAQNVVAQTTTGRADNVVMSAPTWTASPTGPGINDNGSGSAALLEIAPSAGRAPKSSNAVRFAWWGAEELGLVGSTALRQQAAVRAAARTSRCT